MKLSTGLILLGILLLVHLGLPAGGAIAGDKLAVPEAPAQQESLKLAREVYKDKLLAAKTPVAKADVARKMLQSGLSETDPTSKYALLQLARATAAEAGDIDAAWRAIDEADRVYQIDALTQKLESATLLARTMHGDDIKAYVVYVDRAIEDALAADRLDMARPLSTLSIATARAISDPYTLKLASSHLQQIKDIETGLADLKPVLAGLRDKPLDPEGNAKVGKFRCLVKGDWDGGVPLLLLGPDGPLKALAEREFEGPADIEATVGLGDAWWDLADKENGTAKAQMRRHAAHWYHEALPKLGGLAKAKVEKRLALVDEPPKPVFNRVATTPLMDTIEHFQTAWHRSNGMAIYNNATRTALITGRGDLGTLSADTAWSSITLEICCLDTTPADLALRINETPLKFQGLTNAARGAPLPILIAFDKTKKEVVLSIAGHEMDRQKVWQDAFDKKMALNFRWRSVASRLQLRSASTVIEVANPDAADAGVAGP